MVEEEKQGPKELVSKDRDESGGGEGGTEGYNIQNVFKFYDRRLIACT